MPGSRHLENHEYEWIKHLINLSNHYNIGISTALRRYFLGTGHDLDLSQDSAQMPNLLLFAIEISAFKEAMFLVQHTNINFTCTNPEGLTALDILLDMMTTLSLSRRTRLLMEKILNAYRAKQITPLAHTIVRAQHILDGLKGQTTAMDTTNREKRRLCKKIMQLIGLSPDESSCNLAEEAVALVPEEELDSRHTSPMQYVPLPSSAQRPSSSSLAQNNISPTPVPLHASMPPPASAFVPIFSRGQLAGISNRESAAASSPFANRRSPVVSSSSSPFSREDSPVPPGMLERLLLSPTIFQPLTPCIARNVQPALKCARIDTSLDLLLEGIQTQTAALERQAHAQEMKKLIKAMEKAADKYVVNTTALRDDVEEWHGAVRKYEEMKNKQDDADLADSQATVNIITERVEKALSKAQVIEQVVHSTVPLNRPKPT